LTTAAPAGGADLNVPAYQGASDRLAAEELNDLEILYSILLEVASFFCRPEGRLCGAENGSRAQRLLSKKRFWSEQ
jgi:hypothetical protein